MQMCAAGRCLARGIPHAQTCELTNTHRLSLSTPVTSPRIAVVLELRPIIPQIGEPIWPGHTEPKSQPGKGEVGIGGDLYDQ
jgi:hypothetical protein